MAEKQRDKRKVTIFLDGNALRVSPATSAVIRVLGPLLEYKRTRFLSTLREQRAAGGRKVEIVDTQCYELRDLREVPQLVTNAGYLNRIQQALVTQGFRVNIKPLRELPEKVQKRRTPKWKALEDVNFRYRQREVLESMAAVERGQVNWATGSGKGWLIPYFCLLYPRAKIVVTTQSRQVLETNFFRISAHIPDVGLFHGSRHDRGHRVTCVSTGSLHHTVQWEPDIVIADEHHEMATDARLAILARFRNARMYGLSANFMDRSDGADFELEGIFGPLVSEMSYPEAVKHGLTVPIEVNWNTVEMKNNPCAQLKTDIARWRNGIWRNTRRNKLIAKRMRFYEDEQVLITVKTLEHACYLKHHLPEYTLCYAPGEEYEDRIKQYVAEGVLEKAPPAMTHERLSKLRGQFESGKLRKVIATTIWNRGVNFERLPVMARAEAGSSSIDDTQGPGRLSRTFPGKHCGIVEDFWDAFDPILERKAKVRSRHYRAKGWRQHFPKEI